MKNRIRIGPGAASLVLMVVILTMSVMMMLTLISARNDDRLTTRGIRVTEEYYALNAAAERRLASLDAILTEAGNSFAEEGRFTSDTEEFLPEGMHLRDGLICWDEQGDGRVLHCAVRPSSESEEGCFVWEKHAVTALIDREEETGEDDFDDTQNLLEQAALQAQESYDGLNVLLSSLKEKTDSDKAYREQVKNSLPEGMTLKEDLISWTESVDGARMLKCEVQLLGRNDESMIRWVKCLPVQAQE